MTKLIARTSALLGLGAMLMAPSVAFAVAGDEVLYSTLNTSALWSDPAKSYHACVVTNVTTQAVPVKVDLLNSDGSVTIATTGSTPLSLAAGSTNETYVGASADPGGFARCRIIVYTGNSGSIRANETVFYYTGSYYQTFATSEAR